jgi:MYND finger
MSEVFDYSSSDDDDQHDDQISLEEKAETEAEREARILLNREKMRRKLSQRGKSKGKGAAAPLDKSKSKSTKKDDLEEDEQTFKALYNVEELSVVFGKVRKWIQSLEEDARPNTSAKLLSELRARKEELLSVETKVPLKVMTNVIAKLEAMSFLSKKEIERIRSAQAKKKADDGKGVSYSDDDDDDDEERVDDEDEDEDDDVVIWYLSRLGVNSLPQELLESAFLRVLFERLFAYLKTGVDPAGIVGVASKKKEHGSDDDDNDDDSNDEDEEKEKEKEEEVVAVDLSVCGACNNGGAAQSGQKNKKNVPQSMRRRKAPAPKRRARKMLTCQRCLKVAYCNAKCAQRHAAAHRPQCDRHIRHLPTSKEDIGALFAQFSEVTIAVPAVVAFNDLKGRGLFHVTTLDSDDEVDDDLPFDLADEDDDDDDDHADKTDRNAEEFIAVQHQLCIGKSVMNDPIEFDKHVLTAVKPRSLCTKLVFYLVFGMLFGSVALRYM